MRPRRLDIVAWERAEGHLFLVLDPEEDERLQPACIYLARSLFEAEMFIVCLRKCPLCEGLPCQRGGTCARDLDEVNEAYLSRRMIEHEADCLGEGWFDELVGKGRKD